MKDDVEKLIEFIKNLVNDEFDYAIDFMDSEYYFLNGGCLEFVKVLKAFLPSVKIMINKDLHVAIQYKGNIYDARGKNLESEKFHEVSEGYVKEYQNQYGREIRIENKPVDVAIIQEVNNCSGTYVKKIINNINNQNKNL